MTAILFPSLIFLFHSTLMSATQNDIHAALSDISRAEQLIEDPDKTAMLGFYQALKRTLTGEREKKDETAITRIVHYGDSHVAADILTGALRRNFQNDFGNAGPGFIIPGHQWYSRTGLESDRSSRWQVDGLNQDQFGEDGKFGLSGISLTTVRAGERIKITAECRRFELYLLKQPGGAVVDVLLDSVRYHRRFSLRSNRYETAYLEVETAGEGPHTLELLTITPGPARLLGVVAEKSKGVVYDALGINGARAGRPLNWDWKILADNLGQRKPDLIIVSYGSNEVSDEDLDLDQYRKNFSELLHRFHRAAPQASLLVISPPDRAVRIGSRFRTIPVMDDLVEAQRQAAFSSGAAFWNQFHFMGGAGSIDRWASLSEPFARPDRVHLTKQGYRFVAEAFYNELLRGYLLDVWEDRWIFWCRF
jgi:lysophospholipase L1-like esterase